MSRDRGKGLIAIALALAFATACATSPIGARRMDMRAVHRALTASAVSTGKPSAPTAQVLHRLGLFERFARDPGGVLRELHDGLAPSGDQDRLFALAELSFLRGERTADPERLLAASVYAYAFLFPGDAAPPPDPFDPRLRVASDLYNRSLTGAIFQAKPEPGEDVVVVRLPFGAVELQRPSTFTWAGYELGDYEAAADFEVRGRRNRYRQRGIGAPLAARLHEREEGGERPPGQDRVPNGLMVPVTALLRFEDPRAGIAEGRLRATLEVYSQDDVREVTIDGRRVPLEFETTSSLALSLRDSQLWDFEQRGFFSGDFAPWRGEIDDGLIMLQPYRPGLIPVVLVHGTASSPGRWADLVNELANDARIWERYQLWLFVYNTGNPVALSGGSLRRALENVVQELDPEGVEPALRQIVVIGHSQGGLLTKLTSVESGNRFWELVSDQPIDELELAPETRELLEGALFVSPLPFVRRLVFICTPHQGSYLTVLRFAGLQPARLISGAVRTPGFLLGATADLLGASGDDSRLQRSLERIPTSIDNMTPGNPFLVTLASLPIAPHVSYHSVIAVRGDGPPEEGDDGVVEYESAHIEGAESELVVRSGHSAQSHPATIEEVRRILLEHAAGP